MSFQKNPVLQLELTEGSLKRFPQPLYYVESSDDDTVLVAIEPYIRVCNRQPCIIWFDTCKERAMNAGRMLVKNGCFYFERVDEGSEATYRLTPMTLDIYHKKVMPHLVGGREYRNMEDLIQAFLEAKENE